MFDLGKLGEQDVLIFPTRDDHHQWPPAEVTQRPARGV
jgi:hypothetical protein